MLLAISVLTLVAPVSASAASTSFVSDGTWAVYNADPATGPATFLGDAEKVCLNASSPTPCPAGAIVYGFPYNGWFANLSSVPGATWIWAPGVNGATTPADLQQFFFSKTFSVPAGSYTGSSISISADDFAEVRVNGNIAGTIGSTINIQQAGSAQSGLTKFDVSTLLVAGKNTIAVRGQNGPSSFSPIGCGPCSYAQNSAGVVFGGALESRYNVVVQYDSTRAAQGGSVLPIKIQLADANGNNVSASTLSVTATSVTKISNNATGPLESVGNANPDNNFRYDSSIGTSGGYIYNLSTNGLSSGTYALSFTVTGDPSVYQVTFQVR